MIPSGAQDGPGHPPDPSSLDFWHLLQKEVERSRRYYRSFGLVRLDATDGPSAATNPVAREWTRRVSELLRRADVVAAAPHGVLYILLPETPPSTLPLIARRLREALQGSAGAAPVIRQAAFPRDGDSAPELLGSLVEAPA